MTLNPDKAQFIAPNELNDTELDDLESRYQNGPTDHGNTETVLALIAEVRRLRGELDVRQGVQDIEAGRVVDRGSFARYIEDES